MKATTGTVQDVHMRIGAEELEESVGKLFGQFPALCGFSVQHRPAAGDGSPASIESDLHLTEVGLYPEPDSQNLRTVCEEIRFTLSELIQERPEVSELIRCRTFARNWQ